MVYRLIPIIIATILAASVIAAAEYFLRFAIVRKKPRKKKKSASEAAGLVSLDEYRSAMKAGEAWLTAQRMETVCITSHDGLKLTGHFLNINARRTLILFHGYRSRAFRDFSCVGEYYKGLGFNLLFVDQRAHGESEGKYICFGVRERFDCVRWAEYIEKRVGGEIFLDGISMGASTVLMAAGEALPQGVRGIIADCGFTSPAEIMLKVMEADMKITCRPLFRLVAALVRLRAGFSVDEYSTLTAMQKNRIPVLFLHGTEDKFVPCEMTVRAYEACTAEKKLLLIEGAGHGTSYLKDTAACREALTEFFSKYSREASSWAH